LDAHELLAGRPASQTSPTVPVAEVSVDREVLIGPHARATMKREHAHHRRPGWIRRGRLPLRPAGAPASPRNRARSLRYARPGRPAAAL